MGRSDERRAWDPDLIRIGTNRWNSFRDCYWLLTAGLRGRFSVRLLFVIATVLHIYVYMLHDCTMSASIMDVQTDILLP